MIEIIGDIQKELQLAKNQRLNTYDAYCCTTNCIVGVNNALVMGGGIAKIFKDEFNNLPYSWGNRIKQNSKRNTSKYWGYILADYVSPEYIGRYYLIAFPTKLE